MVLYICNFLGLKVCELRVYGYYLVNKRFEVSWGNVRLYFMFYFLFLFEEIYIFINENLFNFIDLVVF